MESLEISWQKNLVCIFWKRKSAVFYISLLFNFRLKQKSKIGIVIASASTWKEGLFFPFLISRPKSSFLGDKTSAFQQKKSTSKLLEDDDGSDGGGRFGYYILFMFFNKNRFKKHF